jgi:hypothetical protein
VPNIAQARGSGREREGKNMPNRKYLGVIAAASLLSSCSAFNGVWNTLSGGQDSTPSGGRVIVVPTPKAQATPQPMAAAASPSAVAVVAVAPAAPPAVAAAPSGSTVATPEAQGLRAELQQLHDDLARQNVEVSRLRQALSQDGASYYGTVAAIHGRLQMGITPGSPEVVAQWNLAQVALDRMSADIARLAVLSGESASDSALATQILDSVKTGGAGAGDQRQLQALEGDTRTAQGQIQQLVDAVAQDIARQTSYLDNERTNLIGLMTAIRSGELYGKRLSDGRYIAALNGTDPRRDAVLSGSTERRPLVVIRFRQPNVAYEDALYRAVKTALERRPSASFDLVAVAPVATTPAQVDANGRAAKRYAENVLRSLTGMGVPAERVSLSATTSAGVKNDEVQIYVR